MKKYCVKIDYSIKLEDITKEVIAKNINVRGCLDQNFYKKLPFNFTSEKAYCIYHEIKPQKCQVCNNNAIFISFTKGYRDSCSKECMYKNPNRMKKAISTCKKNNTYEKGIKKMIKTKENKYPGYNKIETEKQLYYKQVNKITNSQNISILENINLRGVYRKNNNAYHLDHKYSKHYGFINNIPPFIIGHISNLEMIPGNINANIKGKKCSVTKEELLNNFYKY